MPFIARILLLALALPFVLANGGGGGGSGCPSGQFRWGAKDMCLPNGGSPNPAKPPSDTDCPNQWSWLPVKGCCAPHNPPETQPPPQCGKGWGWNSGSLCCKPSSPTPPTNNPPTPSRNPYSGGNDNDNHGNGNGNGHYHKRVDAEKRQHRSRNVTPCPKGLSACPVASFIGGDYECVDTVLDLDNCGGCSALGEGQNCNAIPGVWNVGCEQSACIIYTCDDGYVLSKDGKSCNPSH